MEGFLGALLSNVIVTVLFLDYWLEGNKFWTCAPMRLTYIPFEDYQCAEMNSLYIRRDFQFPFSICGYSTWNGSPAVLYSCCYVIFGALIAPFAGFFGSGLKRAYGIKDFGYTLPGHGGFTDRFDCISLCGLFNYIMITNFIFSNEVRSQKVYEAIREMSPTE